MSQENAISIELSEQEKITVLDAVKTIENTLQPYLISLTAEDRMEIPKMKDKTIPFVEKSLDYVENNSEFAPSYLDVSELKKDIKAVNDLTQIYRPIEQIFNNLNDTIMLAGSEAYIASLSYYNSVKQAARQNIPNAKPVYEDLKVRFKK